MFQSARFKLTFWYLVIIMVISGFFSVAFYKASTAEIQRVIDHIELEQKRRFSDVIFITPYDLIQRTPLEELEESKDRIKFGLVVLNSAIAVFAGGAAFFLAGKTLQPIEDMVEDQNQFLSDASHELRTPISVLRAEMEGALLEKKLSDKKTRILIKSSLEELSTLQLLVTNLLKIVHLGNVTEVASEDILSLRDIVESAATKVLPLAKAKKIAIKKTLKDSAISGSKDSLRELFVILLENAIKYSPAKTTITISSSILKNTVQISVSDEGIGIQHKDVRHIFDRFYRADASRSVTEGHGLGLSIAKRIVEQHRGSIVVKSKPNEGSTFIVKLPKVH